MAKPELGLKRVCVSCGTRFYDLMRQPAVCPKCGTEQPAEQPRVRRAALPPEDKVKKRVIAPEAEADDVELEDAVEEEEGVEDAEDLDDADDAIEEIGVETETREEET